MTDVSVMSSTVTPVTADRAERERERERERETPHQGSTTRGQPGVITKIIEIFVMMVVIDNILMSSNNHENW